MALKWIQSEYDRKMKFERYGLMGAEELRASVTRVTDLFTGVPVVPEEWYLQIFGLVDEQAAPEGYFDPYLEDGYFPSLEEAKEHAEFEIKLRGWE